MLLRCVTALSANDSRLRAAGARYVSIIISIIHFEFLVFLSIHNVISCVARLAAAPHARESVVTALLTKAAVIAI